MDVSWTEDDLLEAVINHLHQKYRLNVDELDVYGWSLKIHFGSFENAAELIKPDGISQTISASKRSENPFILDDHRSCLDKSIRSLLKSSPFHLSETDQLLIKAAYMFTTCSSRYPTR